MPSLVETPELQAMRRYIALTVELKELKARAKTVEHARDALQPSLIAYLTAAGIPSITIDDHMLVTSRLPWIYPMQGVSKQQVCEALKIAGLGGFVKEDYNTQSLTAYVKQLEEHAKLIVGLEDEDPSQPSALAQILHPALASIMHIRAAYSLAVRNSPRKDRNAQRTDQTEGAEVYDDAQF